MGTNALAFKDWATNEGLVSSGPIEQLKGRRIGIDAEDFLLGLLGSNPSREPLLPALGGLPFALQSHVEREIQHCRDAEIEPIFVFNGLDLACRDRASILKESRKAMRTIDQAWKDYDDSQGELAVNNFGKACTYRIYHITRSFLALLHRLGVVIYGAPYSAAAQLATFEQDRFVDAVVGSASCLVFGVAKVVTSIDWDSHRFHWVELKACLAKTGLSKEQFLDVCLLSGSSILPILPEIDNEGTLSRMQAARAALSRAGNDAYNLVTKDEVYMMLFHKARFAVKHALTTTDLGKVEVKDWETAPSDVHEFIGQRLPEEMYYYLSRGIIGPRVLNWRTRTEILELPPLDGGNSQTYRDAVGEKLLPLRQQTLALLTHSLHRYYQNTDVGLVCWHSENEKKSLALRDVVQPTENADTWHVKMDALSNSDQAALDTTPFSFAISKLADDAFAEKTVTPREPNAGPLLKGQQEIRANVIWRFLADRGYTDASHKLSSWGRSLKVALDTAKASGIAGEEADEVIFMALELIRLGLLTSQQMFSHPPYSGAPIRGSDTDKANTMLISRVASLAHFKHAHIGYTGPLSRHLLAYGQLASVVRGALRDLVEMHVCNLFLCGAAEREMKAAEYTKIGVQMPFGREPDLGLGLVVKSYLDELSNEPGKRQDITKWFNHARNIPGDLRKTWKLWNAIVAGVQASDNKNISEDVRKTFTLADQWLKQKLETVEIPNSST